MTDRSPLAQGARAQIENQTPEQFAEYQRAYMKRVGAIDEATANRIAELSSRSDPRAVADFAAQLLLLDLRPKLKSITVPVVEISPFLESDFAAMGVNEDGKTNYYRMLLGWHREAGRGVDLARAALRDVRSTGEVLGDAGPGAREGVRKPRRVSGWKTT